MFSYEGEDVVGHIFFSPVIPRTGEAAIEAMDVFAAIARKYKLPCPPLQFPSSLFERAFLFAVGLPVTRSATVNAKIRDIIRELVAISAERGWGEYRTAPAFYDLIMGVYSYNDHALREFLETIKDAVDPNGIMSPGRYAIRSRHLRRTRLNGLRSRPSDSAPCPSRCIPTCRSSGRSSPGCPCRPTPAARFCARCREYTDAAAGCRAA